MPLYCSSFLEIFYPITSLTASGVVSGYKPSPWACIRARPHGLIAEQSSHLELQFQNVCSHTSPPKFKPHASSFLKKQVTLLSIINTYQYSILLLKKVLFANLFARGLVPGYKPYSYISPGLVDEHIFQFFGLSHIYLSAYKPMGL